LPLLRAIINFPLPFVNNNQPIYQEKQENDKKSLTNGQAGAKIRL
jgi:hypothetical protein